MEISGQDSLYTVRTYTNEGPCLSNSITSGYSDIDAALIGVGSHIQVDPGGYGTFGVNESETLCLEDKQQMADYTTHRHPENQYINNEGLPWGIRRKNSTMLDATETDSPVTFNNEVELFQGSSSFINPMFPSSNMFYSTADASVSSDLDTGPWSWNFDSLEPVVYYPNGPFTIFPLISDSIVMGNLCTKPPIGHVRTRCRFRVFYLNLLGDHCINRGDKM